MLSVAFSRVSVASALFNMSAGYIVCYLANQTKGQLKKLGFVIGVFVIVVSGLLILGKSLWVLKSCSKMCPVSSMNMSAPCPNMPAPKK